jgi:hypothetical protein
MDNLRNLSAFLSDAAQALQTAHDNRPAQDYDEKVQQAVIALVNRLQTADAQARTDASVQSIPLRNVVLRYAFEILCQECTIGNPETRFMQFLSIILDALDDLADFAYSRQGQINLRLHTESINRIAASLTLPHVLHKSSAFGVLHGGEDILQPVLSGSAAVQKLATQLHNLGLRAEGEDCICLDDLIIQVTHHLIEFFESRSGLVGGISHGIIGGDLHTPARDLQELFRLAHSHTSWYSPHIARAHLLKLARYLSKLFTRMVESTKKGFTETQEDIEVCSPAVRILLCAMHGWLYLDYVLCCSSAHHLQCNWSYDPKLFLPLR